MVAAGRTYAAWHQQTLSSSADADWNGCSTRYRRHRNFPGAVRAVPGATSPLLENAVPTHSQHPPRRFRSLKAVVGADFEVLLAASADQSKPACANNLKELRAVPTSLAEASPSQSGVMS